MTSVCEPFNFYVRYFFSHSWMTTRGLKTFYLFFTLGTFSPPITFFLHWVLFPPQLDDDTVPVDLNWLYEHYEAAVKTTDGDDGPFIMGSSAPAEYSLGAGSYLCLLHMDSPEMEKRFSLILRSITPLDSVE